MKLGEVLTSRLPRSEVVEAVKSNDVPRTASNIAEQVKKGRLQVRAALWTLNRKEVGVTHRRNKETGKMETLWSYTPVSAQKLWNKSYGKATGAKEIDPRSMQETRVVPMPGIRLGQSISDWFNIPSTSPGREEYKRAQAEVDEAERNAAESAGTVIIRRNGK